MQVAGRAKAAPVAWTRAVQWGIAGGLLVIPIGQLVLSFRGGAQDLGIDWFAYRAQALEWLHGGSFYHASQLAGHYALVDWQPLYPPVVLWLLIPFAFLPDFLWWAVPLGLTAAALYRMRPQGWWLPATAAGLALTPWLYPAWYGQPTIWLYPAISWGLLLGGWAVFVLLKPSLIPFALIGIHRRGWWVALGVFVVLSLPFGTMWLDWITALRNSDQSFTYSLWQVPILLVPVIAYLGRAR